MTAAIVVAIVALLVILAVVVAFLRSLDSARQSAEAARSEHIEHLDVLYADHRAEIRELLNRYQFPSIMPTTRHAAPPAPPDPEGSIRDKQRRAWLGVGRSEPLAAVPDDGSVDHELGDDIP